MSKKTITMAATHILEYQKRTLPMQPKSVLIVDEGMLLTCETLDWITAPEVIVAHLQAELGYRFEVMEVFMSTRESSDSKKVLSQRMQSRWRGLGATVHLLRVKNDTYKCDRFGHTSVKTVQAGADVAIAVQITTLLLTGRLEHLCFVGGEEDFEPVLERVAGAHHGKPITIAAFTGSLSPLVRKHSRNVISMDAFLHEMRRDGKATSLVTVAFAAPAAVTVAVASPSVAVAVAVAAPVVAVAVVSPAVDIVHFVEQLVLLVLLVVTVLQM